MLKKKRTVFVLNGSDGAASSKRGACLHNLSCGAKRRRLEPSHLGGSTKEQKERYQVKNFLTKGNVHVGGKK